MIVEWFTTWIATKAVGFLVKTIISKEFVEDLVKDYAKDFFKSILNNAVTAPFKQEPLQKAEVMALAEFVQLMQQDLEDGELSEDDIKKYTQPIKQFIKNQEVKQILGTAFKHDCQTIDTKKLQEIWYQLNSSNDFKWKPIGTKYLQKVKEIILQVDELREILNSQNLDKIRQNTTETAGIIPQFDLEFDKPREDAKVMINQLRTRNFMLCFLGADYYAFMHRTFLEYFCAWEFVWQFKETQTLTIEELKTEVFGKHWQDETWHEVLQLIVGMIDPKFAGEIIEYLINLDGEEEDFINLFLAVKCLVEVRNRSVIASTADKLVNLLKDRAIADNYEDVRYAAVEALASNFKDDPDTLPWLKDRAIAYNNWDVRRAAVEALASNFKDDPGTLPWLKERAIADNDGNVRRVAVEALASQQLQRSPRHFPLAERPR